MTALIPRLATQVALNLTQPLSKVISKFPEVSRLRDSMARDHPEVLSGDIVDSVVSQGHCTTRVSSRWLVACCSVALQPHSFCSNIHEYVQLTVKKLLVVNLEPIAAKIRYGFEAATVYAPLQCLQPQSTNDLQEPMLRKRLTVQRLQQVCDT